MTVAELIEKLKEMPAHAEVRMSDEDFRRVDHVAYPPWADGQVVLS